MQEIDSLVLIIYEAPQDYWDYRDYPGGREIPQRISLGTGHQEMNAGWA